MTSSLPPSIRQVTIAEAAEALGVSRDTIRRRLKSGDLQGEQRQTPQGFTWYIALPDDAAAPTIAQDEPYVVTRPETLANEAIELARLQARIEGLERLIDEVKHDRDAWRDAFSALDERRDKELAELREALMQAQAITMSLPARMAIAERSEPTEAPISSPPTTPAPNTAPAQSSGFLDRLWRAITGA